MRSRNNRIHLYLNDDEYKCLQEKVSKANISREQFLRDMIVGTKIIEAPSADYYDLIIQVRRVGSNINQLLKLANAKGIILTDELRKALAENHELEQKMWQVITVD